MWKSVIIRLGAAGCAAVLVSLGAASATQASGWSIQSAPGRGMLLGVSCPSGTTCTAVGFTPTPPTASLSSALVERWNGVGWSIQHTPTPTGAKGTALKAVSCVSGKACVAVGWVDEPRGQQSTLAERWNGSRWAVQATPAPTGLHDGAFDGVSCTSNIACTATATYLNRSENTVSRVARWNGSQWSIEQVVRPVFPHGAKGSVYLMGVSCATSAACTAVGMGFLPGAGPSITVAERWNGSRWSLQQTPNPSNTQGSVFNGVWCTGTQACSAVGENTVPSNSPTSPPTQAPLAERWNGSRWSIQHTPNIPGGSYFNAVSCGSTAACIAVGATPSSLEPIAEGWNGSRWAIQQTPTLPGTTNGFFAMSCNSTTICTAVGSRGNSPLVERHS